MKKSFHIKSAAMSKREVAQKLGVTAERVRQIEEQALRKLSSPKFKDKWQEILETWGEIQRMEVIHG